MPAAGACSTCGAPLSPEVPVGLCPACLLKAGLESHGAGSVTPTTNIHGRADSKTAPIAADGRASEATITPRLMRIRYFGDYRYDEDLDLIAKGGMGVVYRARQVSLDRMVALKLVLPNRLDTELIKRFRQEVESAGNLDHANIVPIYEVGEHDGHHYYSMRLIDGTDLNKVLPKYRKDRRAAARLMVAIARAIHHAHQRGVLHRDLKPHNILVDRDGQPHVADFGLAKRLNVKDHDVTRDGEWAGTPQYMAPEQAAGEFKGLTTAADIYSLGAMLYQVLTGCVPFTGTMAQMIYRIQEEDPLKPRAIDRTIDLDLETICLKCLEKAPDRRYATAGELADDLERWLDGKPIAARPTSRRERVIKWMRRKPAVAALSAAVFLVAVLGLSGIVWQWRAAVAYASAAGISAEAEKQSADKAKISEQKAIAAMNAANDATKKANEATKRATDEAAQKGLALAEVKRQKSVVQSGSARLRLEQGVALANLKDTRRGLVWMAESIVAVPPEDRELDRLSRDQFAAWATTFYPCSEIVKLPGVPETVLTSPDSKTLAILSRSGRPGDPTFVVQLWDIATKKPKSIKIAGIRNHFAVAFSPDGKIFAAGGMDGKGLTEA